MSYDGNSDYYFIEFYDKTRNKKGYIGKGKKNFVELNTRDEDLVIEGNKVGVGTSEPVEKMEIRNGNTVIEKNALLNPETTYRFSKHTFTSSLINETFGSTGVNFPLIAKMENNLLVLINSEENKLYHSWDYQTFYKVKDLPFTSSEGNMVKLSDETLILVSTNTQEIWNSADGGINWEKINDNPSFSYRTKFELVNLPEDNLLLIGGNDGSKTLNEIWRSDDKGKSWYLLTQNAEFSPRELLKIRRNDRKLYLIGGNTGNDEGLNDIWISEDEGYSWNLLKEKTEFGKRYNNFFEIIDNNFYVGGGYSSLSDNNGNSDTKYNDIWISKDNGNTFAKISNNYSNNNNRNYYLSSPNLVYNKKFYLFGKRDTTNLNTVLFSDDSENWNEKETNYPFENNENGKVLKLGEKLVFIGPDIYHSNDQGNNWYLVSKNLPDDIKNYSDFLVLPDKTILSFGGYSDTYSNKIYKSNDNGITWVSYSTLPDNNGFISSLILNNGHIVLKAGFNGSNLNKIYHSIDYGLNFQSYNAPWDDYGGNIVKLKNGSILSLNSDKSIYKSDDEGENWTKLADNTITASNSKKHKILNYITDVDNLIYLNDDKKYIYYSNDGITWEEVANNAIINPDDLKTSVKNSAINLIDKEIIVLGGSYIAQDDTTKYDNRIHKISILNFNKLTGKTQTKIANIIEARSIKEKGLNLETKYIKTSGDTVIDGEIKWKGGDVKIIQENEIKVRIPELNYPYIDSNQDYTNENDPESSVDDFKTFFTKKKGYLQGEYELEVSSRYYSGTGDKSQPIEIFYNDLISTKDYTGWISKNTYTGVDNIHDQSKSINGIYGEYVILTLPKRIKITSYKIGKNKSETNNIPISWRVLGSNDKIKWNILDKKDDLTIPTDIFYERFDLENTKSYKYLVLVVTKINSGDYLKIRELFFYGKEESLGYLYPPKNILFNESEINDSDYGKGLYKINASSGDAVYKVFQDNNNFWQTSSSVIDSNGKALNINKFDVKGEYLEIDLPEKIKLQVFRYKTKKSGTFSTLNTFTIYGSNNKKNWIKLKDIYNNYFDKIDEFDKPFYIESDYYSSYLILIQKVNLFGNNVIEIGKLELLGIPLKDKLISIPPVKLESNNENIVNQSYGNGKHLVTSSSEKGYFVFDGLDSTVWLSSLSDLADSNGYFSNNLDITLDDKDTNINGQWIKIKLFEKVQIDYIKLIGKETKPRDILILASNDNDKWDLLYQQYDLSDEDIFVSSKYYKYFWLIVTRIYLSSGFSNRARIVKWDLFGNYKESNLFNTRNTDLYLGTRKSKVHIGENQDSIINVNGKVGINTNYAKANLDINGKLKVNQVIDDVIFNDGNINFNKQNSKLSGFSVNQWMPYDFYNLTEENKYNGLINEIGLGLLIGENSDYYRSDLSGNNFGTIVRAFNQYDDSTDLKITQTSYRTKEVFTANTDYSGSNFIGSYKGEWVKIILPRSIKLKTINCYLINQVNKYKILGSNNNENWELLVDSELSITGISNINVDSINYYRYYALLITNINSTWLGISSLKLYGKSESLGLLYPPKSMTNNNLIINDQNYGNGYYIVSQSSYLEEGYNIFNEVGYWQTDNYNPDYIGDETTEYLNKLNQSKTASGEWVDIELPYPIIIKKYGLRVSGLSDLNLYPIKWTLLGYDKNWIEIDRKTVNDNYKKNDLIGKIFNLENDIGYNKLRLVIEKAGENATTTSTQKMSLGNLYLIGIDSLQSYYIYPPIGLSSNQDKISNQDYGNGEYIVETSYQLEDGNNYYGYRVFNHDYSVNDGYIGDEVYDEYGFYTGSNSLDKIKGEWIKIELPEYIQMVGYRIFNRNSSEYNPPKIWKILGSKDNKNWLIIDSNSLDKVTKSNNYLGEFVVSSLEVYKYFAIVVERAYVTLNDKRVILGEFEIFGIPENDSKVIFDDKIKLIPNKGSLEIGKNKIKHPKYQISEVSDNKIIINNKTGIQINTGSIFNYDFSKNTNTGLVLKGYRGDGLKSNDINHGIKLLFDHSLENDDQVNRNAIIESVSEEDSSKKVGLRFKTSRYSSDKGYSMNNEILRISGSGLVGIGSTQPNYNLDVVGGLFLGDIKDKNLPTGSDDYGLIINRSSGKHIYLDDDVKNYSISIDNKKFRIRDENNDNNNLIIDENGFIGINTFNPNSIFNIYNSNKAELKLESNEDAGLIINSDLLGEGNYPSYISLNQNNETINSYLGLVGVDNKDGLGNDIVGLNKNDLLISNKQSIKMGGNGIDFTLINKNVGLGTTIPKEKLDIRGNIIYENLLNKDTNYSYQKQNVITSLVGNKYESFEKNVPVIKLENGDFYLLNGYYSRDNGLTWYNVNGLNGSDIIELSTGELVVLTDKLYHSYDGGKNWTEIQNSTLDTMTGFKMLNLDDNILLLGGYTTKYIDDIYLSKDKGKNWNYLGKTPFSGRINFGLTRMNKKIYLAGGYNGSNLNDIWRSNDGIRWEKVGEFEGYDSVYLTNDKNKLILASGNKLFQSSNGKEWELISNIPLYSQIIIKQEWYLISGNNSNLVYYSKDFGRNWKHMEIKLSPNLIGYRIADELLIGDNLVYKNLNLISDNPPFGKRINHELVKFGNKYLLIGGKDGSTIYSDIWQYDGSWSKILNNFPDSNGIYNHRAIVINNLIYLLGGSNSSGFINKLFISNDGINWTSSSFNCKDNPILMEYNRKLIVINENEVLQYNGSWNQLNTNYTGGETRVNNKGINIKNRLFVIGGKDINGINKDIWLSDDGGSNWELLTLDYGIQKEYIELLLKEKELIIYHKDEIYKISLNSLLEEYYRGYTWLSSNVNANNIKENGINLEEKYLTKNQTNHLQELVLFGNVKTMKRKKEIDNNKEILLFPPK